MIAGKQNKYVHTYLPTLLVDICQGLPQGTVGNYFPLAPSTWDTVPSEKSLELMTGDGFFCCLLP